MLSININSDSTKASTLQLPSTWSELLPLLSKSKLRRMITESVILLDDFTLRVAVAHQMLRPYRRMKNYEHSVSEIVPHLEHRFDKLIDMSVPMVPELTVWFDRYISLRESMEDASLREYILADEVIQDYLTDPTEAHLCRIAAVVYRPVASGHRVPLTSREQIQPLADTLQRHMRCIVHGRYIRAAAASAILLILHTKQFVDHNYIPHLQSSSTGSNTRMDFGWHNIAMDVGENGAFGNIENTYASNFHDIMLFLMKKKQDHDAATAATTP